MLWTDEMVEKLKKMWDEGITTGEIGKRLNVSKNSIVGKVHRLDLSSRPSPIKKKADETAVAKPVAKVSKPKAEVVAKTVEVKTEIKVELETEVEIKVEKTKEKETITHKKTVTTKKTTTVKEPKHEEKEQPYNSSHKTSLTQLDNHSCRWPIGDPKDDDFHFCGKKIKPGQTYCNEHSAIAYVKPNKKQ